MSLLSVQDLRVVAPGGAAVVDGVSFALAPGEVLGVVGESGSGKTMTGRAVIRLLPPGLRQVAGRIMLDGVDLATLPAPAMRALRGAAIGMVFQEPMVSLNPAMRVGAQLAEGLRLHRGLDAPSIRAASIAMLERVQIPDPERCLEKYPHEFSGGMRQRLMLASVMLLRPKLLIADEPTTALDNLVQREVLDLMASLCAEQGTAVLLITHNLGLVHRYARRAVVMRSGRIVEEGTADAILRRPAHPYTQALVDALPKAPALRPAVTTNPVIAAQALSVTHAGRRKLLGRGVPNHAVRDATLAVRAGETVGLVGGSGSGKTTLGRALLRLLPSTGTIRFNGAAPESDWRTFRLNCQLVFQDAYASLDPRQRAIEVVAEPLRHLGLDAAARRARAEAMLDEVGLAALADRFPHQLSGGQRQRVAIARAVVRNPAFVVADEPISALDMTIQKQVLELFARLQATHGFACLFISHDLAAVAQVAHRVVVMQAGRIVEQGDCASVFADPRHAYTQALLEAAPRLPD
jgi:peptide/nickel transport system ATP-binding protein